MGPDGELVELPEPKEDEVPDDDSAAGEVPDDDLTREQLFMGTLDE